MPIANSIELQCVYAIRHVASGKLYIGSATNVAKRWGEHKRTLKLGTHHSYHLQRAWDRHGAGAFVFEVLEAVPALNDLVRVEQEYLDHFRPWRRSLGYNICPMADSSAGRKRNPESIAKQAAALRGRKASPETRAKLAEVWRGRRHSPEARARMSAAGKGKVISAETRAKISAAKAGKPGRQHTPEARARMSEVQKGRTFSPEHLAKLSAVRRGRKLSPEHRAKVSAALKGKPQSPETIAKRVEGMRLARERRSVGPAAVLF